MPSECPLLSSDKGSNRAKKYRNNRKEKKTWPHQLTRSMNFTAQLTKKVNWFFIIVLFSIYCQKRRKCDNEKKTVEFCYTKKIVT